MLVSKVQGMKLINSLFLSLLLLTFFFPVAHAEEDRSHAGNIGVIPVAIPDTFINPTARPLVRNIVADTFQQMRSSATTIIHRQSLTGVGVKDVKIPCQSDPMLGINVPCGPYSGKPFPLRASQIEAQQALVRLFYEYTAMSGREYTRQVSNDNELIGLLTLYVQDFEIMINHEMSTLESDSITINLDLVADIPASGHSANKYIEFTATPYRNRWAYDQPALLAKIQEAANDIYQEVLQSNEVTDPGSSLSGF
ncbi:hypothetical protein [Marinospirillum perlucidum]|uniref:hypothetical protein n=1 Tax=Marinospirillum perlucidum TaxID=1982602 RepID=UPI0013902D16|nr:hypothetical protein [Marinospirillum perlucidum]